MSNAMVNLIESVNSEDNQIELQNEQVVDLNEVSNSNNEQITQNNLKVLTTKRSISQIMHNFECDSVLKNGKNITRLDFIAGDTIKVVEKIGSRQQAMKGVVLKIVNKGSRTTFTVRKEGKEGIEKTFSVYSPNIIEIQVLKRGVVRRAKLYYLRGLFGKKARIKERLYK